MRPWLPGNSPLAPWGAMAPSLGTTALEETTIRFLRNISTWFLLRSEMGQTCYCLKGGGRS